ncbi:MAG: hypothetical protein A2745_01125 [Candidatus Harrisonbacteria bacterium RIFCSPHIGHO2_01_FULL_44_13]|uniref:Uncharacterized protein n=1 Tax=Candidatus Harrisonbacteria bacterium RIFCSPLOWO2_01_FULL_44_18 TaxID=1798407 RepID=A0A1G1ZNI1_9BACT|nr:MAG: hypothetical protein A2745_01125 [Candidatus Harrisonbacteria bacterium RIFCSPHIGHO2_01_FULL_44_13]OGY65716.1 MAG: hypothetical protein A3A16_03840 [Candidatus Harrisonbacteria bacterium RIFCSPLOWO2_01_FULL_44_18]
MFYRNIPEARQLGLFVIIVLNKKWRAEGEEKPAAGAGLFCFRKTNWPVCLDLWKGDGDHRYAPSSIFSCGKTKRFIVWN